MSADTFNILITSSSRKVSLVRLFERALKDLSLQGRVYAVDSNPLSATLYENTCDGVLSPQTNNEAAYLRWLMEFCSENKIKLIIPTRDEELPLFARLKSSFNKKGILINISSEETVSICNDKKRFYEYCESRNFPIPKIFRDSNNTQYPCFIKGRYGKGGRLAFKVLNKKELKAFLLIFEECIIQEYIDWPEYTVDYFADFDGAPVSAVPRQRILIFGGESFVGRVVKNKFLVDRVIKFAKGLNLIGHNTIQLFYNTETKQIKFIEVNPRYGGAAALGIAAGANTPLFLIKLALGQPIAYKLHDLSSDLFMLRYTDDIFVKEANLRR